MSNGLCEPSSAKNLGLIIIPRGSSTANREEGDDEDDAVIFVMGVEKGCFCWIALYLKSQVAMQCNGCGGRGGKENILCVL